MDDTTDVQPGYDPSSAALFSNSFRALNVSARSTGFRTHGLRYRSLTLSDNPRIAEEFLVNTRYLRHDLETEASIISYFFDPGAAMLSMVGKEELDALPSVALPKGIKLRRELGEVMARRRSGRSYTGDPIDLSYLATVVRSGGAVTSEGTVELLNGDETVLHFRTAPSGGGLYPIDIAVVALRVTGLDRGIYRYDPLGDRLVDIGGRADATALMSAFAVPEDIVSVSRAAAVFLLLGRPWRSMRKYGNRGMRYVFIEAGAIAQNIHLATTGLGLASVDCASVFDDEAHEALGVDGLYETLIHTIVVGQAG